MKKIMFLFVISFCCFSAQSFPKIKMGAEIILDFGKHKLKDANGHCPGIGICTAKFHVTLDPVGIIKDGFHGTAIDENGNLVLIVSKETLKMAQPEKWNDFTRGSYTFTKDEDFIPSDITSALRINGGQPIALSGAYLIKEYSDCFVITIGSYN